MKETIKKISVLKSIKANEGFKFDLRKKILEEVGAVTTVPAARLYQKQGMSTLQFIKSGFFTNMILPLLIIIGLLGGGAGATYASQASLPGDVLYPVKLVTERAQVALTVDDTKEAALHLKFSSERLEEVEELAHEGKKDPEIVKIAVENYKSELAQAQAVLSDTSVETEQDHIAREISDTMSKNKIAIARVSREFDEDEDKDMLHMLEDAWEEAIEHNDTATILLLQNITASTTPALTAGMQTGTATTSATSTAVMTVRDISSQIRVLNKIAEVSHKIAEAEKYITRKGAQGLNVADAKVRIATAKTLLADAEILLSQNKYSEAFLKAKEAHRAAENAKDFAEKTYKREKGDRRDDDDRIIFEIIASVGTSTLTSTSASTTTIRVPFYGDEDSDDDSGKDDGQDGIEDSDHDSDNDNDRDNDRDDKDEHRNED